MSESPLNSDLLKEKLNSDLELRILSYKNMWLKNSLARVRRGKLIQFTTEAALLFRWMRNHYSIRCNFFSRQNRPQRIVFAKHVKVNACFNLPDNPRNQPQLDWFTQQLKQHRKPEFIRNYPVDQPELSNLDFEMQIDAVPLANWNPTPTARLMHGKYFRCKVDWHRTIIFDQSVMLYFFDKTNLNNFVKRLNFDRSYFIKVGHYIDDNSEFNSTNHPENIFLLTQHAVGISKDEHEIETDASTRWEPIRFNASHRRNKWKSHILLLQLVYMLHDIGNLHNPGNPFFNIYPVEDDPLGEYVGKDYYDTQYLNTQESWKETVPESEEVLESKHKLIKITTKSAVLNLLERGSPFFTAYLDSVTIRENSPITSLDGISYRYNKLKNLLRKNKEIRLKSHSI